MSQASNRMPRTEALRTGASNSPFLREALSARPDIARCLRPTSGAGCRGRAGAWRRRRTRRGRASAAAPGPGARGRARRSGGRTGRSKQVTRLLSDFADRGDRPGGPRRDRGARAGCRAHGFRGHRAWASSAAASSIIRPTSTCCCCSIPRRCRRRERDDAGEAAVRVGRRMIELLQKRTADGYVAARRPAAAAFARSHADRRCRSNAAISHYEFSRAAVGARRVHPRPRLRRRHRARPALPRRDPAVRVAPLARFRSDRRNAADFGADPRPFRPRRPASAPATTSSAAAAASARSSSSPRSSR